MRRSLALPVLLALAACGGQSTPDPAATESIAPATGPRTLVAADFADLQLGPRIDGKLGETSSNLVDADGKTIGTLVSYVACPATVAAETCDPAGLPAGTVYTYVHTVTIDPPYVPTDASGFGLFETTRPATGFNNTIGFDATGMMAALGEDGDIRVQIDNGKLIWRITGGDGLGGGDSLTMFWQSTVPPEASGKAYRWDRGGEEIDLKGPFPPRAEPAVDSTPKAETN